MYYKLSRITAPTEQPITLAEARMQLRVDTTGSPAVSTEDNLISALIDAVTQDIDAGTGWLGRAICPQVWRLQLAEFPSVIWLPYPPFLEIVAMSYVDTNGDIQTLIEGIDFRVIAPEGIDAGPACIVPIYLGSFPAARNDYDTITIDFRCGYGTGSPITADVPEIIKRYIKAALTAAYDSRDIDENAATNRGQITAAVKRSLDNFRVYSQFYK